MQAKQSGAVLLSTALQLRIASLNSRMDQHDAYTAALTSVTASLAALHQNKAASPLVTLLPAELYIVQALHATCQQDHTEAMNHSAAAFSALKDLHSSADKLECVCSLQDLGSATSLLCLRKDA